MGAFDLRDWIAPDIAQGRQPQYKPRLSDQASQYIGAALVGGQTIAGSDPTWVGSPPLEIFPQGIGPHVAQGKYATADHYKYISASSGHIAAVFVPSQLIAGSRVIAGARVDSASRAYIQQVNNNIGWGWGTTFGGDTGIAFTLNKTVSLLLNWRSASTPELWIDGIQFTGTITGGTIAGTFNYAAINAAPNVSDNTAYHADGGILLYHIGSGVSKELAAEWSGNPWSILEPDAPVMYFDFGATSDLNIPATLATATASGYTAAVDRQLGVTATLATATASGYTAAIDRQLAITATVGTAAASGSDASLASDLNISAAVGPATASGYTANIDRQLAVFAALGTADASGYTAGIDFSTDLNVSATLATATASGYTAGVDRQLAITATLAEAAASGYTASLNTSSFSQDDLDFLLAYIQENLVVPTASEIAAAVLAAAAVTPIDANVKEVNDVAIAGTGVPPTYDVTLPTVLDPGDPWRPA